MKEGGVGGGHHSHHIYTIVKSISARPTQWLVLRRKKAIESCFDLNTQYANLTGLRVHLALHLPALCVRTMGCHCVTIYRPYDQLHAVDVGEFEAKRVAILGCGSSALETAESFRNQASDIVVFCRGNFKPTSLTRYFGDARQGSTMTLDTTASKLNIRRRRRGTCTPSIHAKRKKPQ